ncbi:helix-hairpin-helix domain-containing protein [Natronomonas amylolytica]|uniref:helix-hairpin-helix domain-containing protein n=1 Tax=Natronomonas amylolytica TaxID=3108498 RepID=UPI0030091C48
MSKNAEVAAELEAMADHLEARDVDYKPNIYRRAADSIRGHTVAVETLYEEGGKEALKEIDDVGDAIASKTAEFIETGHIEELEELREEMPVEMDALTAVEGVGPKTVAALYDALGIETLDDLEAAAEAGEIQEVKGFGPKTEENIVQNIPFARESRERSLLGEARPVADRVTAFFEGVDAVDRVDVAGSIRRWRPTIGDVDALAASEDFEAVIDAFEGWEETDEVIEAGTNKASVRSNGLRVDLRVVVPEEFGAALQYFTGSKDHNIAVRNRAIDMDLKVNEYGVFDISELGSDGSSDSSDGVSGVEDPDSGQRVGERVAGETEEEVYAAVDMDWMPPELRENRGEVEAAADGSLPDLLTGEDINGDLHFHTNYSDGDESIERMVEAAAEFGHDYVSVGDHATGPGMVGGVGLSDEELLDQMEAIRAVAEETDIEVFAGVEANIDEDGGISVGDDVLAELDCVVASPHSGLDGDGTDRLVAAIEHPEVDIIGHPTGRMLNQRPGHDIDIDRVAEAAADNGTALEINSDPRRLDLRSSNAKAAIEAGATISVNTDAHRPGAFEYMRFGVHTARRGWCEPDDVLNCRDVEGLRDFLGL